MAFNIDHFKFEAQTPVVPGADGRGRLPEAAISPIQALGGNVLTYRDRIDMATRVGGVARGGAKARSRDGSWR